MDTKIASPAARNDGGFQVLVWSVVLGVIFVSTVYAELAMPEFNSSLLALQGLSAGTFVALKIPEATTPKV